MKPKVAEKKDPPADPPSIKNLRIDSNPNTEENNSHATQKLTQESPGHSRRSGALRKLAKGEHKQAKQEDPKKKASARRNTSKKRPDEEEDFVDMEANAPPPKAEKPELKPRSPSTKKRKRNVIE